MKSSWHNIAVECQRGALDSAKDSIATNARRQVWDLDALGNWDSLTTDGGSPATRSHNKQNQITAHTYDANGNLVTDGITYDPWNRMTISDTEFRYDALGRRITETPPPSTNPQPSTENNIHDLYDSKD